MRPKLTVVIIAYNEAHRIRPCLLSVADWADEIVVLDSCSTDDTVKVAREFTDNVIVNDLCSPAHPDGYSVARNFAISQATGDWIFSLDADERATPSVRSEIDEVISNPNAMNWFEISRVEVYSGIQLDYVYDRSWLARLFKAGTAEFDGRPVHESLVGSGPLGRLQHPIMHHSKDTLHQFLDTQNRYTTLEVAGQKPARLPSATKAALFAARQFLYRYVYLRGYRDGTMGFIMSAFLAGYAFESWAKQWEAAYRLGETTRGTARMPARLLMESAGKSWRAAGSLRRLAVAGKRPQALCSNSTPSDDCAGN